MAGKDRKKSEGITVIRKEEVIEGGHHGGAWKVAYADFVTAMMAFFLLMWLINATTEAQRRGLADYFAPMNVMSRNNSGSGQPFGGHTPYDDGSLVSDKGAQAVMPGKAGPPPDDPPDTEQPVSNSAPAPQDAAKPVDTPGERAPDGGVAPEAASTPESAEYLANAGAGTLAKPDLRTTDTGALRAELVRREQAQFNAAAQQIRDAVANDPGLAQFARQLSIDLSPEGLRIQLLDQDKQPMFASGSAVPDERARLLLAKIAPVLAKLPQAIAITGHTDAAPYKGNDRSNWDLSSDRATATRRLLSADGLAEGRFREVSGRADRDLLLPADPLAAANRRIAILVMASATPLPK